VAKSLNDWKAKFAPED
jgi:hypothetical protein